MYMCDIGIDFVYYYGFSVRFLICSDNVVFLVFLLDFRTVPTVWYFLFSFSFIVENNFQ